MLVAGCKQSGNGVLYRRRSSEIAAGSQTKRFLKCCSGVTCPDTAHRRSQDHEKPNHFGRKVGSTSRDCNGPCFMLGMVRNAVLVSLEGWTSNFMLTEKEVRAHHTFEASP